MSVFKDETRLRQVAVLLTSVDAATSRQLLGQFSIEQARKIRSAMAQLGNVTPEERRRILSEFKTQTVKPRVSPVMATQATHFPAAASPAIAALHEWPLSGDSLEISEPSQFSTRPVSPMLHQTQDRTNQNTNQDIVSLAGQVGHAKKRETNSHWQNMPTADLAELLTCERPTVIAVVINQVSPQHATQILDSLPRQLASEALAAVPLLQSIDADILSEIHRHLQQRLSDYTNPKLAFNQGLDRLRAILMALPRSQRAEWATSLISCQPNLATHLSAFIASDVAVPKPIDEVATLTMHNPVQEAKTSDSTPNPTSRFSKPNAATQPSPINSLDLDPSSPTIHSFADAKKARTAASTFRFPFEQLGRLPASDLAAVLKAADPAIVLLAMSGASDTMYAQILKLMNARDAKRVEARLNQLGSIQLKDVDLAQEQITQIAAQMLSSGQIGSFVSMSLTAAA